MKKDDANMDAMAPATKIIERVSSEERKKLLDKFLPFLSRGKFVNVATCSLERMPNVAPKLVIKTEENTIYLVDYVLGRTYTNLRENPRVSLSLVNDKMFTGYQLNGTGEILEKGPEVKKFIEEFQNLKTELTVERILLNVRTGEKGMAAELALPERFAILKIKVIEIVEITSSGRLRAKLALE